MIVEHYSIFDEFLQQTYNFILILPIDIFGFQDGLEVHLFEYLIDEAE